MKGKTKYGIKNNNGITLIALVVTIIVLIILAGISINLVLGENGIITKAKEASKAQKIAQIKEEIQLEVMAKQASDKGDISEREFEAILETKGTLTSEENILERTLITQDGHQIKVSEIYNGKLKEDTIYKAYTRGEEVTIQTETGEETFYVLEDSDNTKETVTLFAKYNLNKEGTAQQANSNYVDTASAFSTSNYWKDEKLDVTPKFNLNRYDAVIADTESAVYKAKSYATTLFGENVEGRLLTYEEAIDLQTAITTDETGKIAEMLWGEANTQEDGKYLLYWLGSARDAIYLWRVSANYQKVIGDYEFYTENRCGVRPVIEVLKSEIIKPGESGYMGGNYDDPYIPIGFKHKEGTWNNGYTIIGETESIGNEFVWVPCITDKAKVKAGDKVVTFGKTLPILKEDGTLDTNDIYYMYNKNNYTITGEEDITSTEIETSVGTYGGFYIAKYEAGIEGKEENYNLENKTATDGSVKPLSQKEKGVWNYISRSDAIKVSKEMIERKKTGAKSALISGAAWDTTLRWMVNSSDNASINEGYDTNSKDKGWYNDVSLGKSYLTGYYAVNNIYDMAGNISEHTTENCIFNENSYSVSRGGYYNYSAVNSPVANRNYVNSIMTYNDIGFRVVLYK